MKKLLIVEDDEIAAKHCADALDHAGYALEVATEGESALSAIPRFKPDAIVYSYFLRDLHAPQFLARLRAKPETKALPVVVLVPSRDPQAAEVARKAGANKCVPKERSSDRELLKAVKDVLTPKASLAVLPPTETAAPASAAPKPKPAAPVTKPAPTPPQPPAPSSEPAEPAQAPRRFPGQERVVVGKLKSYSVALLKAELEPEQISRVADLNREAQTLQALAAERNLGIVSNLTKALASLLESLVERPYNLSPSTLRTIFQTAHALEPFFIDPSSPALEGADRFCVLAVDDDDAIRRLVARSLEGMELEAQTAKDPLEALDFAEKRQWDLFILDVNMPHMNGFELCARLRAQPKYAKTPVVFLTGCDDIQHRILFARSKADDFIAKPFLLPELNVKVLSHLLAVAARRALDAQEELAVFRTFKAK